MNQLDRDIVEVLFTPEMIQSRVAEMGKEIADAYADSVPLLVGVLKGCALFIADLIQQINIPLEMDFMAVLSYEGRKQSNGTTRIIKDLDCVIKGREILLIEGIVDTGMTVGYILRNLQARRPRSIRLCTFLDKPARRIIKLPIEFKGFEIPDRFVVGYGLDFNQLYRNLPYIGVLKDDVTGLNRQRDKGGPLDDDARFALLDPLAVHLETVGRDRPLTSRCQHGRTDIQVPPGIIAQAQRSGDAALLVLQDRPEIRPLSCETARLTHDIHHRQEAVGLQVVIVPNVAAEMRLESGKIPTVVALFVGVGPEARGPDVDLVPDGRVPLESGRGALVVDNHPRRFGRELLEE